MSRLLAGIASGACECEYRVDMCNYACDMLTRNGYQSDHYGLKTPARVIKGAVVCVCIAWMCSANQLGITPIGTDNRNGLELTSGAERTKRSARGLNIHKHCHNRHTPMDAARGVSVLPLLKAMGKKLKMAIDKRESFML